MVPDYEHSILNVTATILTHYKAETPYKTLPILEEALKDKMNPDEIEEALDKLAKEGNLFRPRHGFVQKV